jgi:hypothetical protein
MVEVYTRESKGRNNMRLKSFEAMERVVVVSY